MNTDQDYERFRTRYHTFAGVIKSSQATIHGYLGLVQKTAHENLEAFPDTEVRTELELFSALVKKNSFVLQNFFWAYTSDSIDVDDRIRVRRKNMERWEPYDEAAWEAMTDQLTLIIDPYVKTSMKHLEKINAKPLSQMAEESHVSNFLTKVDERLQRLLHSCSTAKDFRLE